MNKYCRGCEAIGTDICLQPSTPAKVGSFLLTSLSWAGFGQMYASGAVAQLEETPLLPSYAAYQAPIEACITLRQHNAKNDF